MDDYVAAFTQHYGPGGTGPDFIRAMEAVSTLATPKFEPWQRLLMDVVEVEVGAVRTVDAIRALNMVPPADALEALGLGIGRWMDNHIALWALSARALIQRTEDLATRSVRRLVKGNLGVDIAALQSDVLAGLDPLKTYVKKIRDPYAHGGGFIVGVAKDGNLERAVLTSFWPDAIELMDGLGRWHEPWAQVLAYHHEQLLHAESGAFAKLDAAVPWKGIAEQFSRKPIVPSLVGHKSQAVTGENF